MTEKHFDKEALKEAGWKKFDELDDEAKRMVHDIETSINDFIPKHTKLKKPFQIVRHESHEPLLDMDEISDIIASQTYHIQIEELRAQEAIIIDTVKRVGGDEYHQVTVDDIKLKKILSKAVPVKPIVNERGSIVCPTCRVMSFGPEYNLCSGYNPPYIKPEFLYNYCPICGQSLEWEDK